MSAEAIKALVSNVTLKLAKGGEVVIKEGDDGDEMYFVIEGSVVVLDKGEQFTDLKTCKVIAELGPGCYFGEMALLAAECGGGTRTRTVVAKCECELYVLKWDQFEVCMEMYSDLRWSINHEADQRKSAAEAIAHPNVHLERRASVVQIQDQAENIRIKRIDGVSELDMDKAGVTDVRTGAQASSVEMSNHQPFHGEPFTLLCCLIGK